ncbi:hypothetical protein [Labedaea rhizosphaerae]|uniref:Uncharacterized protein n=1 Tax=Labedaea rhizosphaerae TaxID=598644 RepID=A0A4R6SCE8_LABRH|nr:hypothetical protein [Labedaea rhizosphaerae]TDP97631.1 hypothetical protein EV186_103595 [Labedaea rhizosphaerae]
MTDQPRVRRPIPSEGEWGPGVAIGVDQLHWIAPGAVAELRAIRDTYRAACDRMMWRMPETRDSHWASWPRCGACQRAADRHVAAQRNTEEG